MKTSITLQTIFSVDDFCENYSSLTLHETEEVLTRMEKVAPDIIYDYCHNIFSECVDEILSENGKQK